MERFSLTEAISSVKKGGEGDRKNSVDPLLLACFSNASEIIRNALNWAPVESQNPAAKLFLPRSTDRLANVQESLSLSLFYSDG